MLKHKALLAGIAAAVVGLICISQGISQQAGTDQPGGRARGQRPDPAQVRQQMMDRMKETLGASDAEWKTLGPMFETVTTLSREARDGMGGMGGMGGAGRRGARNAETRPAPEPTTETGKTMQALSKVLDNKEAKPAEIKSALQAVRDARAQAEAKLAKAEKDVRAALTVRQEGEAVRRGWIR